MQQGHPRPDGLGQRAPGPEKSFLMVCEATEVRGSLLRGDTTVITNATDYMVGPLVLIWFTCI